MQHVAIDLQRPCAQRIDAGVDLLVADWRFRRGKLDSGDSFQRFDDSQLFSTIKRGQQVQHPAVDVVARMGIDLQSVRSPRAHWST